MGIMEVPNILLRFGLILLLVISSFGTPLLFAEEAVKINILALNPSPSNKLKTTIVHHLPEEIKEEDVVDAAGMAIKYDQQKKVYFLTQEVELDPKEARTITVKVRDVWHMSSEMVTDVKKQLEEDLKTLTNTKYEETGKLLYEKVMAKITSLEEEQARPMGMRKRIELYRAHMKQLESIEGEVMSIESLRRVEEEQKTGVRTATFTVIAENPSEETKTMTVRALLPRDVKADDVIDKLGFSILYDADRDQYALEKQEKLMGKERKKYEIVIRDLWYIQQTELDYVKDQTEKLVKHFVETDFEDLANQHQQVINKNIEDIVQLQDEVKDSPSIKDRSRAFVLNTQRFNVAKRKVKELQDLLLELPPQKAKLPPRRTPPAVLKLLDVLNRGFKPNLQTTWWVIMGIIGFLGAVAVVFYVVWIQKLGQSKFNKATADKGKSVPPK